MRQRNHHSTNDKRPRNISQDSTHTRYRVPLLFDKEFTISKFGGLPSCKAITDRLYGNLLCYPLGHLNMPNTIYLKHHIPNINSCSGGHTHNTLSYNIPTQICPQIPHPFFRIALTPAIDLKPYHALKMRQRSHHWTNHKRP